MADRIEQGSDVSGGTGGDGQVVDAAAALNPPGQPLSTVQQSNPLPSPAPCPPSGPSVVLADRKIVSDILTTWIQVVALVVAGLFAAIQYVQKVEEDKVRASLDFYVRYSQPPLFETRRTVEKAWQHVAEEREAEEKRLDPDAYATYALGVIDKAGVAKEMMIVVSFFGAVEICVQNNICDEKTAVAFLQADAKRFYALNSGAVRREQARGGDPELAEPLLRFTRRTTK